MWVLASILGCKAYNFPTKYLDMPLEDRHKGLGIWNALIWKTKKRLANWKTPNGVQKNLLIPMDFQLGDQ